MNIILQVGVKAILKDQNGKILLLKRNQEKYPEVPNLWDIIGGRIDPGVGLIDNLKREILEETGLSITNEPKIVTAQDILRIEGKHTVRITYVIDMPNTPVTLSDEHSDYGWFNIDEISKLKENGGVDIYFMDIIENQLINSM